MEVEIDIYREVEIHGGGDRYLQGGGDTGRWR